MIYIVSGHERTGTSMMMHALITAGMEGLYDEARQGVLDRHARDGYHPNKNGVYEVSNVSDDTLSKADGKVIKVFVRQLYGLQNVYKQGIRAVFMTRDVWEIRASSMMIRNKEIDRTLEFPEMVVGQAKAIEWLANRKDVLSLDVFDYHDVVSDPIRAFSQLAKHGWNIDVGKAVGTIDPTLCHVRR